MKLSKKQWVLCGSIISILWWILLLYPLDTCNAPHKSNQEIYTSKSWETMIPQDCQFFFDGCNDCARQEDWKIACHELYCEKYQKPTCTDNTQGIKSIQQVPACWTGGTSEQCAIFSPYQKNISREEAKNLILEGKVKSLFQAHSLQVDLTTDEGSFTTQEPAIDEVFEIIKKCGEACKDIPLATE